MGRPRKFDPDIALNRALQLFWAKGYSNTSTRDLVSQLELGQQSIYNAFGDKESLFERCLRLYETTYLDPRFVDLEKGGASRQEIVRFFAQTVEFLASEAMGRGCMFSSVALGAQNEVPAAKKRLQRYQRRILDSLEKAVLNAVENKEIFSGADPKAVSSFLCCTVHGMAASAKLGVNKNEFVDIAATALRPFY